MYSSLKTMEYLLQSNEEESSLQVNQEESLEPVSQNHQPSVADEIQPSISSCIFFDIETSDLQMKADILEIGAVWGEKEFDVYITPQNPINENASAVNHITFVDNVLYYKEQEVEAHSLAVALGKFLNFIREAPEPRILIGYNIKKFDCPFIFTALSKVNLLQNLEDLIVGFIDSYPLYKEFKPDFESHKQSAVIKNLLNVEYEEHNALADVISLQDVFYQSHFDDQTLFKHFFACLDVKKDLLVRENKKVLMDLKRDPSIRLPLSEYMIDKVVKSGLSFNDLFLAFNTNGKTGILELLQGQIPGNVLITNKREIIDGLCSFFNDFIVS